MKLFERENNPTKNALTLGQEGSGKKSFVYYYKDKIFVPGDIMSPVKNVLINESVNDQDKMFCINFILDRNSDDCLGFIRYCKEPKADLILILADLASPQFHEDVEYYKSFATIHFPEVEVMVVGTKADIQLAQNTSDSIIATSAKTGEGFNEFRAVFHNALNLEKAVEAYYEGLSH